MTGLGCALSQAVLRSPYNSKTITYPVQNNIYLNSRRSHPSSSHIEDTKEKPHLMKWPHASATLKKKVLRSFTALPAILLFNENSTELD